MYRYRERSLLATAVFALACVFSTSAHAEQYTRTKCGGSFKDPLNFYWADNYAVGVISSVHQATGRCDGHLNKDSICGTEQTWVATTANVCRHTYRKPCGGRSNYRRFHARIYDDFINTVFSHQDQGCRCVGQTCTADGARFNPGRDNQNYWVITKCRSGLRAYFGNTMSMSQSCGVGHQASDGYVWKVQ